MHNQKTSCRKHMRQLLGQLTAEERAFLSEQACRHFWESHQWQTSQHLCLFVSYGVEIETRPLLAEAWSRGKNVYLPKCWPDKAGEMDFFQCNGFEELEPGQFGIMEPSDKVLTQGRNLDHIAAPDCILVPGLAFTMTGQRLGKGGGFYDRFMAREMCRNAVRVGFGFAVQVVEALPVETWDLPLHCLCTENGLVRLSQFGE